MSDRKLQLSRRNYGWLYKYLRRLVGRIPPLPPTAKERKGRVIDLIIEAERKMGLRL